MFNRLEGKSSEQIFKFVITKEIGKHAVTFGANIKIANTLQDANLDSYAQNAKKFMACLDKIAELQKMTDKGIKYLADCISEVEAAIKAIPGASFNLDNLYYSLNGKSTIVLREHVSRVQRYSRSPVAGLELKVGENYGVLVNIDLLRADSNTHHELHALVGFLQKNNHSFFTDELEKILAEYDRFCELTTQVGMGQSKPKQSYDQSQSSNFAY